MKFVDEASINVEAGNGGSGIASFRREKYIPLGGPDGGDGGDGGSIYLLSVANISTLVDFRHQITHKAQNGQKGSGKNCSGKKGKDLYIRVPAGVIVYEKDTGEKMGDLTRIGQTLLVAKGGFHGLGNARFKSSTNRSPQQFSTGSQGESRTLQLELVVIADVGLLGLPNAGKSSFIRAVSAAKPKVADYPFTTLYPNLGVVKVDDESSFVVADIPGVIEGAAAGAGLGIQFLKHLSRTKILLHLVDIAPNGCDTPAVAATKISAEVAKSAVDLASKPRWLVLNKIDLIASDQQQKHCEKIIAELNWQAPVFVISTHSHQGISDLIAAIAKFINQRDYAQN